MRQHLKHFFIPHEGNNYHPHILHTKRAVFYSAFFLALKGLVFVFAMLIPSVVFVMPDVLASEENKLLTLTNNLRIAHGIPTLSPVVPLHVSSDNKASEMSDLHYFSHTSPNGYGLAHFLSDAGYRYETAGENLAMGFSSAEEIFAGWVKSPTHYANLIDPDYTQFGVAMENGTYNDLATVYVAQHFGAPKVVAPKSFPQSAEKNTGEVTAVAVAAAPSKASAPAKSAEPVKATAPVKKIVPKTPAPEQKPVAPVVAPEPIVALAPATPTLPGPVFTSEPVVQQVHFLSDASSIDWQDQGDKTLLNAKVAVEGDVQSVSVFVGQYVMSLQKGEGGIYTGTLLAHEPVNNFFKPIVEPSITILGKDRSVTKDVLVWQKVKLVSPTPLEKYTRARDLVGIPSHVFEFSRGVYLFFIVFFSLSLLISIVVEIRRQHHHIIAQTLGLIVLLTTLFLI